MADFFFLALVAFTSLASADPIEWSNWPGTAFSNPISWNEPATEQEIIDIVQTAHANNERVSVVGSGHSSRALVPTTGHMISLDNYKDLVRQDGGLFTFEAGIRIREILEILESHGRTIENTGRLLVQSLAGAVSTNTHGTGRLGGMSTQIEDMTLISSNGTRVFVSRTENPLLFNAARMGLGVIGVVSTITLTTVPIYYVRREVTYHEVDDIGRLMEEIHSEFDVLQDRVRFSFTDLGQVALEKYYPISEPIISPEGGCWSVNPMDNCSDVNYKVFSVPNASGTIVPPQPMHEALVPLELDVEFVKRWIEIRRTTLAPFQDLVRVNTGLRYVGSDDIWLSPMNRRNVMAAVMTLGSKLPGSLVGFAEYRRAFCNLAYEFKARMHWGKESVYEVEQAKSLYAEWDLFVAQRELIDPDMMFMNNYTESFFA